VVHGDLYEAQVIVDPDGTLGLIDLDDLSVGDPAMDAANMCAHLMVLAMSVPLARDRLMAYRGDVAGAFSQALGVSETQLARREAVCALRLATGPFRVLEPDWPRAVERRVEAAAGLLAG
jgi:aminoglycoside phosphotransferase (APT) family kinase protein